MRPKKFHYVFSITTIFALLTLCSGCTDKNNKVSSTNNTGTSENINSTGNNTNTTSSGQYVSYATPTTTINGTPVATPTNSGSTLPIPQYGDATGSSTNYCNSPGIGNGNQYVDYLRIQILKHGFIPTPTDQYIWTSKTEYGGSQNNLVTDSRLYVRVLVKPHANNKTCPLASKYAGQYNDTRPYSKLKVTVALIDPKNPTKIFEKIQFTDVKAGQCSEVRAFATIPVTNDPLILWISEVQSDTECLSGRTGYCPYTYAPEKSCWGIELHVATDDTKDIPR